MLPTQLLCVLRAEVQLIIAHGQIVYMLKSESVVIIRKSNTRLTRDLPQKYDTLAPTERFFSTFTPRPT